ncbi:hypothetical protein ACQY0O_004718 [Thecaphora frezii]
MATPTSPAFLPPRASRNLLQDWQATNLLLLLLHPIPTVYLPDRPTAQLALRLGIDYRAAKAIEVATERLRELDEHEQRPTA